MNHTHLNFIQSLRKRASLPPLLISIFLIRNFVLNHLTLRIVRMSRVKSLARLPVHEFPGNRGELLMQIVDHPAPLFSIKVQAHHVLAVRVRAAYLVDVAIIDGD